MRRKASCAACRAAGPSRPEAEQMAFRRDLNQQNASVFFASSGVVPPKPRLLWGTFLSKKSGALAGSY